MISVSTQAPNGASRAVGTHYGPTRIHAPTGANAIGGTARLAHRCSIIPATAVDCTRPPGRLRAAGRCWGWAPPPLPPGPQDLPRDYGPGRSSGKTKPEYTAASGRRDHATFGSGPTRQSDDRDSEPDYLLRPTRHGQGGALLDSSTFLFGAQVTDTGQDLRDSKGWSFNDIFGIKIRYF